MTSSLWSYARSALDIRISNEISIHIGCRLQKWYERINQVSMVVLISSFTYRPIHTSKRNAENTFVTVAVQCCPLNWYLYSTNDKHNVESVLSGLNPRNFTATPPHSICTLVISHSPSPQTSDDIVRPLMGSCFVTRLAASPLQSFPLPLRFDDVHFIHLPSTTREESLYPIGHLLLNRANSSWYISSRCLFLSIWDWTLLPCNLLYQL